MWPCAFYLLFAMTGMQTTLLLWFFIFIRLHRSLHMVVQYKAGKKKALSLYFSVDLMLAGSIWSSFRCYRFLQQSLAREEKGRTTRNNNNILRLLCLTIGNENLGAVLFLLLSFVLFGLFVLCLSCPFIANPSIDGILCGCLWYIINCDLLFFRILLAKMIGHSSRPFSICVPMVPYWRKQISMHTKTARRKWR